MSFLRYGAYKDSGVECSGTSPHHWDVASLRWHATLQGGIAKGKEYGERENDADQLRFLEAINDRLRQQEDVMAQIQNHPPEQVMHGLYPQRVVDTVLDVMIDYEKMSLSVLDNETASQRFALLVLRILTAAIPLRGNGDQGVG
jgi:hypothetical protein